MTTSDKSPTKTGTVADEIPDLETSIRYALHGATATKDDLLIYLLQMALGQLAKHDTGDQDNEPVEDDDSNS